MNREFHSENHVFDKKFRFEQALVVKDNSKIYSIIILSAKYVLWSFDFYRAIDAKSLCPLNEGAWRYRCLVYWERKGETQFPMPAHRQVDIISFRLNKSFQLNHKEIK